MKQNFRQDRQDYSVVCMELGQELISLTLANALRKMPTEDSLPPVLMIRLRPSRRTANQLGGQFGETCKIDDYVSEFRGRGTSL